MSGVTLAYPATGDATLTVDLPWPAHDQAVELVANETVNYSPSGTRYTVRHGPPRYRITRLFESLTEAEAKSVIDFWHAIGGAGADIAYRYVEPVSGDHKSVTCCIVSMPQQTRRMKNIWDMPIQFEQGTHPNQSSDPTA